jgi:hypothetical protein
MGPLRGWWTYAGERAMHFVKQHIKTSGKSFEKNAMNKYNNNETVITKKFYGGRSIINPEESGSTTLFFDETSKHLHFDNFPCKLLKYKSEHKPMKFSSHEMDRLLECLLSEVTKQCTDNNNNEEAETKSTIFRLQTLFKTYKFPRKSDDNTFYNWILIVYDLINESTEDCRVSSSSKFVDLSVYSNNVRNLLKDRNDFLEIKDTIISLVDLYKTMDIYQNAIIFGERFSSRGFDFRESFAPTQEYAYGRETKMLGYKPKRECNQLCKFDNWNSKRQYSSWCRFNNPLNRNPAYTYSYGQINYFFRLKCASDKILHGLPIANIVYRTFSKINRVDKIICTEFDSMNSSKHPSFVPITNIYASPILLAPFDRLQKPIIIDKKKFKPETIQYCSTSEIIDHALLFDLFPYRTKHILYNPMKFYNTFENRETNK